MIIEDFTKTGKANGKLEQILKNQPIINEHAKENGHILLIYGPPGAGKTTFGLYLLKKLHQDIFGSQPNRSALMLSIVEPPEQIIAIADIFGIDFRYDRGEAGLHLVYTRVEGDKLNLSRLFRKAGQKPEPGDVLLIDGISYFKPWEASRQSIFSFINQIKKLKIFAILVAEVNRPDEIGFMEYAVDSIIHLNVQPFTHSRYLEIKKMRWHDYHMGKHSFILRNRYGFPGYPGIAILPSTACLTLERTVNGEKEREVEHKGIPSGVPGFDDLVENKGGPFRPGDSILMIGPPGVGKSLIGIQFLKAAKDGESVFISFSSDYMDIKSRIKPDEQVNPGTHFYCLHYNPTNLVIDEVVGAVHNILTDIEAKSSKTIRLYIDGIATLRCIFDSDEGYNRFLISFLQLLATFPNLVSLLSYQISKIFASYSEIPIPTADHFTVIIGLNFQEQHNALQRGLVVLKCLGRKHESELQVADIKFGGSFIVDPRAGWPHVGLLGGERERVREAKPFIKIFYENGSEEEIVKGVLADFELRYPEDHVFREVAKKNPVATHWSFSGYAGAGHSNTKIVALRKYVMDVIRENGVFMEVPEDFKERFPNRLDTGFLWEDYTAPQDSLHVLIPYYADVGVLVYQKDALLSLKGLKNGDPPLPKTWDELIELKDKMNDAKVHPSKPIRHLFLIPNTINDTKNFVAFFFELCWAYGWDFQCNKTQSLIEVGEKLVKWVDSNYFQEALDRMWRLVYESDGKIPNPNIGGHYHESVFSRRWFSKIHLLPKDAEHRMKAKDQEPFQFVIAKLPGIEKGKPGVSCVDLYALGILKDALAPETGWMLATELLEYHIDVERTRRKRGIPISRNTFETRLVQDNFRATIRPLERYDDLFKTYPDVLNSILIGDEDKPCFRRTSDIPKFYDLENLLGKELPGIFDATTTASKKETEIRIKNNIKNEIMGNEEKEIKGIYCKNS
jgi:KaiC/GvpD/RAD55 family RecA-like ATPase